MQVLEALERARALVRQAEDEAAKQAYLDVLRRDPTNFFALNELGTLALAGGFRSAARTAYSQAIAHHPDNKIARVNLANVLREDNDPGGARIHYEAALAVDPDLHEAHQGMAWVLTELGLDGAEEHRERGFSGHALVTMPYRGTGAGVPILLLVSARGGNIPTRLWIDDRRFTIHALYTDYVDPAAVELPPHTLVVNAIGDADLCPEALDRAERLLSRSTAPVINHPARVRPTGRAENAKRLAAIPGVIAPRVDRVPRSELASLEYPLLLRSPGFHTGRHFVYVPSRAAVAEAAAALAGEELLAIQYLDARGADGMARKYRVMLIAGRLYPLHLAISSDWKVHYFTADMARSEVFRASCATCRARSARGRWRHSRASRRCSASSTRASISRCPPTARCCCSRPTPPWWCFRRGPIPYGIIGARPSRRHCRPRGGCWKRLAGQRLARAAVSPGSG
jgi:hypothetical protein